MIYYKVKPEFDNVVVSKNFDFLIGNELFTANEFKKIERAYANRYNYTGIERERKDNERSKFLLMFEPIEISKRRTYFSFGARFEKRMED